MGFMIPSLQKDGINCTFALQVIWHSNLLLVAFIWLAYPISQENAKENVVHHFVCITKETTTNI